MEFRTRKRVVTEKETKSLQIGRLEFYMGIHRSYLQELYESVKGLGALFVRRHWFISILFSLGSFDAP